MRINKWYLLFGLCTLLIIYQNCAEGFKGVKNVVVQQSVATGGAGEYKYLGFQIFIGTPDVSIPISAGQLMPPPDKATLLTIVQDILNKIGTTGQGDRKLSVIFGPIAFDHTDAEIRQIIQDGFDIAIEKNVAVGFHIDDAKFWTRREDLWQDPNNVEWLDWNRTPSSGTYINWGTPAKFPRQMCYNSPRIQQEAGRLAQTVIGAAIRTGMDRLQALGKPELFSTVIVGWESGLSRDFDTQNVLGFCGFTNLGYSSSNPPENPDQIRVGLVSQYVQIWSQGLLNAGIPKDKMFSHVATASLIGLPIAEVNYSVMPVTLNNSNLSPGVSIYGAWTTPDQLADFYTTLDSAHVSRWALVEGTNNTTDQSMETYLAKVYNRGGVLTNIFGWGVGEPGNEFRRATEGDEAITAFRKFLRGETLQ